MDEALELRRMLLWFKAQLPPHRLENWNIRAQPEPPAVQVEGENRRMAPLGEFRIEGGVYCERCGAYFPIPSMGNARAWDEARIPAVVEEMKEWVEREARQSGPCWGDVPRIDSEEGFAVMDLAGQLPN